MSIAITKEAYEAGDRKSADLDSIKRALRNNAQLKLTFVPLLQDLQSSKTSEELFGYVRGASRALRFDTRTTQAETEALKEFMKAYLEGVYENLGLKVPSQSRSC